MLAKIQLWEMLLLLLPRQLAPFTTLLRATHRRRTQRDRKAGVSSLHLLSPLIFAGGGFGCSSLLFPQWEGMQDGMRVSETSVIQSALSCPWRSFWVVGVLSLPKGKINKGKNSPISSDNAWRTGILLLEPGISTRSSLLVKCSWCRGSL